MAFGAAFIAANSSSSYKVRKVFLTQHPEYDIKIRISPLNGDAEVLDNNTESESINYNKEVVLYKTTDYLGQKKTINLSYDRAMEIKCFQLVPTDAAEPTEELLMTYTLDEIETIANNDIAKKTNSTVPKVSL